MSSWVVEYASQRRNNSDSNSNSHDDGDQWLQLLQAGYDPTASNISLPSDAYLKAAISLKDQVFSNRTIFYAIFLV